MRKPKRIKIGVKLKLTHLNLEMYKKENPKNIYITYHDPLAEISLGRNCGRLKMQ